VIPEQIAGIGVPRDPVSVATWDWALRALPGYLFDHSVRAFCWAATIAAQEDLVFDARILWTAALMHDVGLTRIARNTTCFEFAGAARARRFLVRQGMPAADADRAALAIELHMAPTVTLDDGTESVLLDRATGLDVRGVAYERVDSVRPGVLRQFPRGAFDRHFLAAIRREVALRPGCQSDRFLNRINLAAWMARSPWATDTNGIIGRTRIAKQRRG
jgi:hypothetical protein